MKTLFTIVIVLASIAAEAQTRTHCVRNYDGSYTCTTYGGGRGF